MGNINKLLVAKFTKFDHPVTFVQEKISRPIHVYTMLNFINTLESFILLWYINIYIIEYEML